MNKLMQEHRNKIQHAIIDCLCDTKLTQGETLAIFKNVRVYLNEQIDNLCKDIGERTKLPSEENS